MAIQVFCPCETKLGDFAPFEDHSGIYMVCPSCGKQVLISNGHMSEVIEHPDDYEPNDRITVEEHH